MKFIIIGGDAAGMSAASRAKRNMPELDVIVLEQSDDVSYSACGMPYNIADPDRDINDLVVRQANVFREKQNIDLRNGHRVEEIDTENKTVRGEILGGNNFEIDYDYLLIATGASPIMPDMEGIDHHGVMGLKSLEDGRKIKTFIAENGVKRVIILGMGYIALEMVEALRARDIRVEMVKPRPVFLPWLHEDLSQVVKKEIDDNNVISHLGIKVLRIEKENNMLKVICEDRTLTGDMILVAMGVKPNSKIAGDAGLEMGPSNAISVNKALRTSNEFIYSAGDCADAFHVVTGKKTWIPLALRANRSGWAVADNVVGKKVELQGVAGTAVFKVFDMQVARTGLNMEEAKEAGFDPVEVAIKARSRAHAHPGADSIWVQMVGDRNTGKLLGAQLVGREGAAHRVNAPAVALHAGMTVEEFSQSDLAYAPPFSPTWDPMLTTANQLIKKI